MIFTIAWRELRTLFMSPLAWIVFVVMQLLLASVFLLQLVKYADLYMTTGGVGDNMLGITESIAPVLFLVVTFLFLIVVPLLTMRLFAEERRNKTLTLLLSAPISMSEIVLGKYLGTLGFLLLVLLCVTLMPLSLAFGAPIDYGIILSGLLGAALAVSSIVAVGIFMSLLTHYTAAAAIASLGLLQLLWWLDPSGKDMYSGNLRGVLSLSNHLIPFLQGLFDSTDALYYVLLTATFLVLSVRKLDADRIGG
jgi:ABC-2 type transport system permease protein